MMNPPPIPPHSDLSGIGHLQRLPSTPERSHVNHLVKTPVRRDLPPIPIGQKSCQQNSEVNSKVDSKEEMRQRELDEVRARVAQMEKTMRWWSDCTANWREKWSKVRNERNQAREEKRALKVKLDTMADENNELKKKNQELEFKSKRVSSTDIKADMRSFHSEQSFEELEMKLNEEKEGIQEEQGTEVRQMKKAFDEVKDKLNKESKGNHKLSEALGDLQKRHDRLTEQYAEVLKMKVDYEEEMRRLREWKEERLEGMRSDLEEDMVSDNEAINPRLFDLHKELERLQLENAKEWTLREKLETEKLGLERENKRLRADLNLASEELSKSRLLGNLNKSEVCTLLQEELNEKNKEVAELKATQSKMKKQLQELTSELEHSRSRAEHYEVEVKKLRGRVEQLKRDLANAEDESDQQSVVLKRLQRVVDEMELNKQQQQFTQQQQQQQQSTQQQQHSQPSQARSIIAKEESQLLRNS